MDDISEFALRMGDNALVLGHRVSEWCGHAPALEEDIALANVALDLIGQARMWLTLAGEHAGRTADDLAFRRDAWDFRNLLLVEQPNHDFAVTMTRQFLFDALHLPLLTALSESASPRVAEIAVKSAKEAAYHLDRSRGVVAALGDGTPESNARMRGALDRLWPFSGEAFQSDDLDSRLAEAGIAPDPASLRPAWRETVTSALTEAALEIPDGEFFHRGGRDGSRHTEHLGHMLAGMQFLQRAYPEAAW